MPARDVPPRSSTPRGAGIITSWRDRSARVSPHFYNDVSDIDAALEALARNRTLLQMSR